jgi:Alternative complex III, ActD subunit
MSKNLFGYIARFDSPSAVMHAAEQVRDAGFTKWDVITPFPIHGLDAAMGIKRSRVPRFSLAGGVTGFTCGMLGIWAMNAWNYPLVVGGKPYFSPMFAFPVSYELTILLTAFATIIGMFLVNRLPMHYHPVLKFDHVHRATDDAFFVVLEAMDPRFTQEGARRLLQAAGATEISDLEN